MIESTHSMSKLTSIGIRKTHFSLALSGGNICTFTFILSVRRPMGFVPFVLYVPETVDPTAALLFTSGGPYVVRTWKKLHKKIVIIL